MALAENGFAVDTRAVRLHSAIRRIGEYPVTIQFGNDMKVDVEITVNPDRPLEDREEMEFDDEGNLVIVEKTAEPVSKDGENSKDEPQEPACSWKNPPTPKFYSNPKNKGLATWRALCNSFRVWDQRPTRLMPPEKRERAH